jgi:hypothetical protein
MWSTFSPRVADAFLKMIKQMQLMHWMIRWNLKEYDLTAYTVTRDTINSLVLQTLQVSILNKYYDSDQAASTCVVLAVVFRFTYYLTLPAETHPNEKKHNKLHVVILVLIRTRRLWWWTCSWWNAVVLSGSRQIVVHRRHTCQLPSYQGLKVYRIWQHRNNTFDGVRHHTTWITFSMHHTTWITFYASHNMNHVLYASHNMNHVLYASHNMNHVLYASRRLKMKNKSKKREWPRNSWTWFIQNIFTQKSTFWKYEK